MDIGLTNIFEGWECEMEQRYDDCYHCWSSTLAKNNQEYLRRKLREEEEADELKALREERLKALQEETRTRKKDKREQL